MKYGIVIVSHSSKIAAGVKDLISQAAPDLSITTAGETDEGEIGSSLEKIQAAVDDNTGDELPLILALARNNSTEPLQERIYGISSGDSELIELFRKYKISPKIAEIFTK